MVIGFLSSVLLFPPLPSRLRYLIHKTVEDLAEFTTFSIGESWYRRVVVCHSDETEEDSDLDSNNSLCEESLRSREEMEGFDKPKSSIPPRSRGSKRPDKPLYVPRAARQRLSMRSSQGPTVCEELSGPASGSCACISSSSDSCSCYEATENTISSTSRQEPDPILVDGILTINCNQLFCVSYQIKAHLKDTLSFSIEHVHNDYSIYENMFINSDEFRHVIEIYDFPSVFKTADLLDAFMEYSDGGMKIKWVDNTHALGVFSSESAGFVLTMDDLMIRMLLLCCPPEFIQPVKERPRTDCAVARRMVSRALGLQGRGRVQRY
uniref:R3H domain and coiled-coil containing 1 n=1 Tax=Mastacembelus armatus TaxID=205130 RepID=A0A7N8WKD0_9TELE